MLRGDRHRSIEGRVLLAFRCHSTVLELNLSHLKTLFPTIDVLGANLYCASGNLKIFIDYIPPDTAVGIYSDFIDSWEEFCMQSKSKNFLIMGDFNAPLFLEYFMSDIHGGKSAVLRTFVEFLDLTQCNGVVNVRQQCLDLVFSVIPCFVTPADFFIVPKDAYHAALNVYVNLAASHAQPELYSNDKFFRYNFCQGRSCASL